MHYCMYVQLCVYAHVYLVTFCNNSATRKLILQCSQLYTILKILRTVFLTKYYSGDPSSEVRMTWHVAGMGRRKCIHNFGFGYLKERYNLDKLSMDGKIILICICSK